MKALIERRIAAEDGRIGEIEARLGPVPDAAIRARLASELRDLTDEDRSVALSLCALVAQDADLRAPIQEMMRRRIAKVLETSTQPRGALLAFLAIEGLMALRSEEHTSELQSLMRISYAVFCLKKKKT